MRKFFGAIKSANKSLDSAAAGGNCLLSNGYTGDCKITVRLRHRIGDMRSACYRRRYIWLKFKHDVNRAGIQ